MRKTLFFSVIWFSFFLVGLTETVEAQSESNDTTKFTVLEISDIPYANAKGYWTHLATESTVFNKISMMKEATDEQQLGLCLDLFLPLDDSLRDHPLVMLIHGGAFYFGSKDDVALRQWCQHIASQGFVAASIDYRTGFLPTAAHIQRAGYRALQDAHAALRYLVSRQETFTIDTSLIVVGGCSAGAITALNLAYMTNDMRPEYTYEGSGFGDLGAIDTCGNDIRTDFKIKGVIDMWGALPDTAMMRGHDTPILAIHGDADDIVPYGHDYPFGAAGAMKSLFSDKMYGSSCIVEQAHKTGVPARLVTLEGQKHAPHYDPQTHEITEYFYVIQDAMDEFLKLLVKSNSTEP